MTAEIRYSWTQPSCAACYEERNPGREPSRLLHPETEKCVYCGKTTASGIYVRVNPNEAPYPTAVKE